MQDNILVLNFSDAKVPEFKEVRGKDWVYYGEEDNFPDYLLTLYNKSAKHGAIVNNKVTYIFGSGLMAEQETPQTIAFLKNANPQQSWNELTKQSVIDVEVFGGFYWQVIPDMLGRYHCYLMPFSKVRVAKDGSGYLFKNNWKDRGEEVKSFPKFAPGIRKASVFHYREYRPSSDNRYSLPGYMNACNYIEADVEVSKHTLTNAKTGFSASKFINFYNGEPDEEKKRSMQRRFENAFTGSEGKKILIGFNNDPNKKPTVDDLGASDLTKEDFTAQDNLITSNIYAGHQITSPMLFGIQTPEKLGGHSELKISYEIFKNTYANGKQRAIEDVVNYFAEINGLPAKFKLKDVDPVGFEITSDMIKEVAPKAWILDKVGVDPVKYPEAAQQPAVAPDPQQGMVNENLKNMTGRQFQQVERIKRKFKAGQLTRDEAAMLLKNSLGLSDDDINVMLGDAQAFEDDTPVDDEALSLAFDAAGESMEEYEVIRSKTFKFDEDEEQTEMIDMFRESTPGGLLSKIANISTKFLIRYSYEKRKDATGPTVLETTRPFCKKMVALDRMYSRQDIQKISEALGYNVFKRTGGFWNKNGKIVPHCRHEWRTNIVVRKEKKQ